MSSNSPELHQPAYEFLVRELQDWIKERRADGFKNSDLTNQCSHRLALLILLQNG